MKYQIPAMLQSGGGSIVNMASILGQVAFAGSPAYVAAKHGVVGLTQNAALEYSAQGVRVNAIGPGFIRTPLLAALEEDQATMDMLVSLHPIGRLGQAEERLNWLSGSAPTAPRLSAGPTIRSTAAIWRANPVRRRRRCCRRRHR